MSTDTLKYDTYNSMAYCWFKPANYNPAKRYALVLYMHQNDNGTPYYTSGGSSADTNVGPYVNSWFNSTEFQTDFNCFVVAPLLDQSSNLAGDHVNFGGYDGTAQPSTANCIGIIEWIIANYPIDTGRIYVTGASMGGSGTIVDMLLYNTINGTNGGIFTAGLSISGVDYDAGGATPNQSVITQMQAGVPLGLIHGATDTDQPATRFSLPLWNDLGGSGTPSTWTQAGTTNCYLLIDPNLGHDAWDYYYSWPVAQTYFNWLFSFSATPVSTPAAPTLSAGTVGTSSVSLSWPPVPAGSASPDQTVVIGSTGGSITDASGKAWTITAGGLVAINGVADASTANVTELAYVSGQVWRQNSSGTWWYSSTGGAASWQPPAGTTTPLTQPVVTYQPAYRTHGTSTVLTTTSGGSLTDAAGNVWTLTSNGDVMENGTAVPGGAGTGKFAIVNGLYYAQDAATGQWYTYSTTNQFWSSASAPTLSSSTNSGPWTNFGSATTATSAIVTGLAQGTAFDFEVVASSNVGSTTSNVISATTLTPNSPPPPPPPPPTTVAPSIPSGLVVSGITSDSLNFAWGASTGTAPISYQPQYRVHVGTSPPPPPPPPPTTPPPPPPASPDGTVVKTGSGGSIVDSAGNAWTITSGGQVAINGVADGSTANVTELAYVSGQVWRENSSGIWWSKSSPTATWQPPSGTSQSPLTGTSADFRATMLTWLQGLQGKGTICCQQLLGQSTDDGSKGLDSVYAATGKHPGGLGGNYYNNWGDGWPTDANNDTWMAINWATVNPALIAHWNAGGIVLLSGFMWPAPNLPHPGGAADTGVSGVVNGTDLVTPGTATYNNLLATLDDVAAGMQNLVDNGVDTILFRPWHEMQGNWFWWATTYLTDAQFIKLWKITYNYLGVTKGLANHIIWVYGACTGPAGYGDARYPGDAYVDIAGWDDYTNDPASSIAADASVVQNINKPRAYCEWGPADAPVDETVIVKAIKNATKPPIYWEQWSTKWAISNQTNLSAALNDPYVLTRENLNRPSNPIAAVPGQPTGLTVTSISTATAALAWSAPTTGGTPTTYTVQAATITGSGSGGTPLQQSASGAAVTNNAFSIVDTSNNIWAIDSSAKATCNGTELPTANVVGLAYISGTVWQINSSVQWYTFSVSNGVGANSGGPFTTPSYSSPSNTTVTGVGPGIIDSSGNLWGLTSSKKVVRNGVIDTSTSNVVTLAYVGGKIWQGNTSNQWYSYVSAGNWSGGGTTSPLTGAAIQAPLPSSLSSSTTRPWQHSPGTNFNFWNWPLGQNCSWGSASDADTQDLRNGGYINPLNEFGCPFYVASASDLPITFSVGNQGGYANQMYDGSVIQSENWNTHLPAGANSGGPWPIQFDEPIQGCDLNIPGWYYFCGPIYVDNYQGGMTYHIDDGGPYNVNGTDYTIGPGPSGNGTSFYREPVTLDVFHTQQEYPPSPNTIYNVYAGMIRSYDIDASRNPARVPGTNLAAIQHVLRYSHDKSRLKANGKDGALAAPLNPNSWPLNFMDWQGTNSSNLYTGNLLVGTHVGIPSNVPMPSGLTDAGKQVWHCLQTYGASFHDQGGGGFHLYADQDVAGSSWKDDAQNDLYNTIVGYLCPLRNQHKGGDDFANFPVNGPGPRMDPGPVPQALIPGFPIPSPNYTTITGTNGSITDSLGTIWTITSGKQVAYQVTRSISNFPQTISSSPVADTSTFNAVELAIVNGVIWHKNTSGDWYCKTWSFSPMAWAWMTNSGSLGTDPITAAKATAYPGTNGPQEISATTQGPWVTVGTTSLTNDVITGLTPGTKYLFQVIAGDDAGQGPASPTTAATTLTS